MTAAIIERTKKRLTECQDKHKFCPSVNISNLPKRIVDIGTGDSSSSLRLHLSGPDEKAPYVALSYCWGGPQDITTTLMTLQSHTTCLPAEKLPRTIQDAITVTRSLGIRYLWIDALCIIQDDQADKLGEISAMGGVYRNATLTIAAASASAANDGFLQDRTPLLMCQLPFYLSHREYGSVWLRKPEQVRIEEPLDSRAWALQESLLSPRILYYATKDLIWKCQTGTSVAVKETHNPYYQVTNGRLPKETFGFSGKVNILAQQTRIWKDIIKDYSGRKLSLSEDRLPALAGIAAELQKVWKDDYVAGMWRRCLVRYLGWRRAGDKEDAKSVTASQSPSWSWVSFQGSVWVFQIHHEEAEVLDVASTLVDENSPFGPVHDGSLVLRAPFLPSEVRTPRFYCCMDSGSDRLRTPDDDSLFLLLGFSVQRQAFGLIVVYRGGGTFRRVGCWGWGEAAIWSGPEIKREVIKIV